MRRIPIDPQPPYTNINGIERKGQGGDFVSLNIMRLCGIDGGDCFDSHDHPWAASWRRTHVTSPKMAVLLAGLVC